MTFPELLMLAVSVKGNILGVAELLNVPPKSIYEWIAGVAPEPAEEKRCRLILEAWNRARTGRNA